MHQIDSLPVVEKVDENGKKNFKVIGRVSKTNVTKVFVDLAYNN